MNQNRNQKILEHCIKKIADSDWFKNEFPNVEFCLDHNSIYSIDDKKIRIGLEKEKLQRILQRLLGIALFPIMMMLQGFQRW